MELGPHCFRPWSLPLQSKNCFNAIDKHNGVVTVGALELFVEYGTLLVVSKRPKISLVAYNYIDLAISF